MRKTIAIIAACLLLFFAAYTAGHKEGMRHAIEDSVIWTVECYNPYNPEENARPDGTDQTIYIEIDNNLYAHGMIQG